MIAPGRVVCVSFATADYYSTLHELIESVKPYVDGYLAFYDTDLPSEFVTRNRRLFEDGRGFGYWVWKPYVILEALERVEDGDIVVYIDAGNLVIADLQPLVDLCAATSDGVLLFDNRDSNPDGDVWKNSMWTTADCFSFLDADSPLYTDGSQVDAAYLVLQKRPESVAFVRELLEACQRYELLREPPSETGPELPGFVEHRWDQSILSILAIRHGVTRAREPSQDGNRAIGPDDTYGQVFDHHRGRFRIARDSREARRLLARARRRARARRLLGRPKEIRWLTPPEADDD